MSAPLLTVLPYVTEEDRYLNSLPMFYTAGTGITYSMLLAGGSVALVRGLSYAQSGDGLDGRSKHANGEHAA